MQQKEVVQQGRSALLRVLPALCSVTSLNSCTSCRGQAKPGIAADTHSAPHYSGLCSSSGRSHSTVWGLSVALSWVEPGASSNLLVPVCHSLTSPPLSSIMVSLLYSTKHRIPVHCKRVKYWFTSNHFIPDTQVWFPPVVAVLQIRVRLGSNTTCCFSQ